MRNQILSVDTSSKNRRSSGNIEIKKIVRFFAIIMIIFSIGFISMGTYAIVENNNILIGNSKPEVNIEKQNDKLIVNVSSNKGIEKIIYVWNEDGEEKTIEGNNQTSLEEIIELPVGNNSLKLIVYDVNGRMSTFEKEYEVESKAPQLSIEASNGKIKITAKDNEKMSYITYRWDEDEETKIDATEESSAQIEKEVEIPKGQHKLTVVAVNSNNLTTTKEQEVKGITKPKITVVQDADDMKYLVISASDDEAVKEVSFELNGQKYKIDLSEYQEKTIQYKQEMAAGENKITVTVTNFDGAESTFEGICTYNP